MSGPSGTGGLRRFAAPESVGALLAVVVLAILAIGAAPLSIGGATPSASPDVAAPSASAVASSSSLSATTRSALLTALAVDQRLAGHLASLEAAIDGDVDSGAGIAAILRTMNQDLAVGVQAAAVIARDPMTANLGGDLSAFYAEVAGRTDATLDLSIREGAAYRAGAIDLVELLGALPEFDDRIADAVGGRVIPSDGVPSPSASTQPSPIPPSVAPSRSPAPSAGASGLSSGPPAGPSLVVNGTFDTDLAGWDLDVESGADADARHEPAAGPDGSGAARIDISVGTEARAGIAFVSPAFDLERGRRYRVSAMLRSAAPREVRLRITTIDGRTTTARSVATDTTWSATTFEVTELAAGSGSRFALDLGRGQGPVWLDDVRIVAVAG